MDTYKVGTLAFEDSFAGLMPCKVVFVDDRTVVVRYTANRPGGVLRGNHREVDAAHVIPRSKIRRRNGTIRIATDFRWEHGGTRPKGPWTMLSAAWLGRAV